MPPLYLKIWFWILMNVDEESGSVRTSLDKIAADVAWDERGGYRKPSRRTISRAISELEVVNSIETEVVYRSFTKISVVNWGSYQAPNEQTYPDEAPERYTILAHKEVHAEGTTEGTESTCASNGKAKTETVDPDVLEKIHTLYQKRIHSDARLTAKAKDKIRIRMKEFDPKEIQQAIVNFSKDVWHMEHNGRRGLAWFFHSEDRIQGFIDMEPRVKEPDAEAAYYANHPAYKDYE